MASSEPRSMADSRALISPSAPALGHSPPSFHHARWGSIDIGRSSILDGHDDTGAPTPGACGLGEDQKGGTSFSMHLWTPPVLARPFRPTPGECPDDVSATDPRRPELRASAVNPARRTRTTFSPHTGQAVAPAGPRRGRVLVPHPIHGHHPAVHGANRAGRRELASGPFLRPSGPCRRHGRLLEHQAHRPGGGVEVRLGP